jgi:hypothetical protein
MLTRAECLQILELDPAANAYEIETRYAMLLRRYRNQTEPEIVERVNQITQAYNILTGRYVEPEPEDPRMEKVIFGKTRKEWQNRWHYGRLPLLFGTLIVAFLVYIVVSIVTNKPPDLQITAVGLFTATGDADERVANYVREVVPGAEKVEYQLLPIDLGPAAMGVPGATTTTGSGGYTLGTMDAEQQSAYVMKMAAMLAGDSIEVYVCDLSAYNFYAPQGVFRDLTGLYNRLQDLPPEVLAKIKPLRRAIVDTSNSLPGETTATPDYDAMNLDASIPISGLDVSALHLTEGLGLYNDSQILTIGFKASDVAKTEAFLEKWIRDYEKMNALQKAYEDSLKATAAATR